MRPAAPFRPGGAESSPNSDVGVNLVRGDPSLVGESSRTAPGYREAVDFQLEVRRVGDRTVVGVSGDLDVLTAPRLRDRLGQIIDDGRTSILVDLTPCEFIDSSGLSALVTAFKRVRAEGGALGLVCPPGNVRRLIEVVALDQVFEIRDDLPVIDA